MAKDQDVFGVEKLIRKITGELLSLLKKQLLLRRK